MDRYLIINISDEKDAGGKHRHKAGPTPVFLTEKGVRLGPGDHTWVGRVDPGTRVNAEPGGTLLRILEGAKAKEELADREKRKAAAKAKASEAPSDGKPKVVEVDPSAPKSGPKVTEVTGDTKLPKAGNGGKASAKPAEPKTDEPTASTGGKAAKDDGAKSGT